MKINSTPKVTYMCKFLQNKKYRDIENYIDKMIDYYSDEDKKVVNMIDYFSGSMQEKEVNLVLANGKYATKEEKKKMKRSMTEDFKNSNLWQGVLSFDTKYLTEAIPLYDLEKLMAQKILPSFFKECGFVDSKKMNYCFSFHNNTANIHCHFAFTEKEPNFINRKNELCYRRRGMLTQHEINFLKNEIVISIEREKVMKPTLVELNQSIEELKKYFRPKEKNYILQDIVEIHLEEKILQLGKLIKQYRTENNNMGAKIKYNSIKNNGTGKEIKKLTKEIKRMLFQCESSILFHKKKEVEENLQKLNDYYNRIKIENHIEEKEKLEKLTKQKKDYIENFILNAIVNHAYYQVENMKENKIKTAQESKIEIEDLVLEITSFITKNSKNFESQEIKKNVIKNSFVAKSNKKRFPYQYELEQSLKNINKEMKECENLFHELFKTNREVLYDEKI